MLMKHVSSASDTATKSDIKKLSAKIDRNQKALDNLDGVSKKIDAVTKKIDRNQKALNQLDDISAKIDRNQKALDELEGVGRILRDNEHNLKELGNLKNRLDTLDKILVHVDKIAGDSQSYRQEQELNSKKLSNHGDRLEKVEKHLNIAISI